MRTSAPVWLGLAALALASVAEARKPPPPIVPLAPLAAPVETDWRTPDPQNVLVIDSNKGRIIFELSPTVAPLSAARVRELTRKGIYDGRTFFRVIDNFMDQTGDPLDTGAGGSSLPNIVGEFTFRRGPDTPLTVIASEGGVDSGFIGAVPVLSQTIDLGALTADHRVRAYGTFCPGVGGMARSDSPDSGNSQFFLMRGPTPNLDQQYTPFGRVLSGMDVVRSIKTGQPVEAPQDKMLKVRVLADIPAAERPSVRVIDTAGAWFKAKADRIRTETGLSPVLCDLDLPSQIK